MQLIVWDRCVLELVSCERVERLRSLDTSAKAVVTDFVARARGIVVIIVYAYIMLTGELMDSGLVPTRLARNWRVVTVCGPGERGTVIHGTQRDVKRDAAF